MLPLQLPTLLLAPLNVVRLLPATVPLPLMLLIPLLLGPPS
jgi:hypothetical protein